MTPLQAFAHILDCDLTQDDYNKTKKLTDGADANVLPNYHKIKEAKSQIISKEELEADGYLLTDTEMIVPMKTTQQNLTDSMRMKIPRIKKKLNKAVASAPEDQHGGLKAKLTSKAGYDGFTSHAQHRQLLKRLER